MTPLDTLLERVYRDPRDDEPREQYARVLKTLGDPLGEFITLQLRRAAGRRGDVARERLLLATRSASWWPGHPCWFGEDRIPWEHVHRGMPDVFAPPRPVDEANARALFDRLPSTFAHPGWSTIVAMSLPPLHLSQLLARASLGSLEVVRDCCASDLDMLGTTTTGVTDLAVSSVTRQGACRRESWPFCELPRVTGLPRLQTLRVGFPATASELYRALESLAPCGLLPRVLRLELYGVELPSLDAVLTSFGALPSSIERWVVYGNDGGVRLALSAPRSAPALSVKLSERTEGASGAALLNGLASLPSCRISSVRFELTVRAAARWRPFLGPVLAKWGLRASVCTAVRATHDPFYALVPAHS